MLTINAIIVTFYGQIEIDIGKRIGIIHLHCHCRLREVGLASHKTKLEALRRHGCLHAKPEAVQDELFVRLDFFDSHDLLQVKYEMVRRVRVEGQKISHVAHGFGCSRPTLYQAMSVFEQRGLAGLLPQRPGPRRAHKLSDDVVGFVEQLLSDNPELRADELASRVQAKFDLSVHPRSIERALDRREKKRR